MGVGISQPESTTVPRDREWRARPTRGLPTAPAESPAAAPAAASLRKSFSEMLALRAVVSASQICAYLMREVIRDVIRDVIREAIREAIKEPVERRSERIQKRRHRQVEHANALWRWCCGGIGLPSSAVVSAGAHARTRGGGEWRTVRIGLT